MNILILIKKQPDAMPLLCAVGAREARLTPLRKWASREVSASPAPPALVLRCSRCPTGGPDADWTPTGVPEGDWAPTGRARHLLGAGGAGRFGCSASLEAFPKSAVLRARGVGAWRLVSSCGVMGLGREAHLAPLGSATDELSPEWMRDVINLAAFINSPV